MDVSQICSGGVGALGSAHAYEVHRGVGRLGDIRGEVQTTRPEAVLQDRIQTRLPKRHRAGGEGGDLGRIRVDADDIVAQGSHAGRMCCSQISGPHHAHAHAVSLVGTVQPAIAPALGLPALEGCCAPTPVRSGDARGGRDHDGAAEWLHECQHL